MKKTTSPRPGRRDSVVLFLSCCVAVCSCLYATSAQARVQIETKEVRSFIAPAGFDPFVATLDNTDPGTTLLYQTVGVELGASCVIVIASDAGARGFSFQYNKEPTECLSVVSDRQGGFFIRGFDPLEDFEEISALTTRVDGDGVVLWTVKDRELLEAKSEADGGTGSLIGSYVEAAPTLLYSEKLDRVFALSSAALSLGSSEKALTQAHVIKASDGRLMVSGQTFGQNGLGNIEGGTIRGGDGHFFLHAARGEEGTSFYTYDARNMISAYDPMGQWQRRKTVRIHHSKTSSRVLVLWSDESLKTGVSLLDAEGRPFYDRSWSQEEGDFELGRPVDVYWGEEHIIVTYRVLGALWYVRVLSSVTGESLGVESVLNTTDVMLVGLRQSTDGKLHMVGWDAVGERFREYELSIEDLPDEPVDVMDGDMSQGGADMGDMQPMLEPLPIDIPQPPGICMCRAPGGSIPTFPWWVFVCVGMLWFIRDKSSSRNFADESTG